MLINFDCILSILEKSEQIKLISSDKNLDGSLKLYTFYIKERNDNVIFSIKNKNNYDIECCKYCEVIGKSDIEYLIEEHSGILKAILKDYRECIIQNKINGCKFNKDDCFKNAI